MRVAIELPTHKILTNSAPDLFRADIRIIYGIATAMSVTDINFPAARLPAPY